MAKKKTFSRRPSASSNGSQFDWVNALNKVIEHGPRAIEIACEIWNRFKGFEENNSTQQRHTEQPQKPTQIEGDGFEWWRVLGVKMYASPEQIEIAFREKMAKVHPDKVAHLSEKLQEVAELEAKLLIEARRQGLARFE